jgi:hypothetical protein
MFTDQSAQKNFAGKDGEQIATSILDLTQAELEQLRAALGDRVQDQTASLQARINASERLWTRRMKPTPAARSPKKRG